MIDLSSLLTDGNALLAAYEAVVGSVNTVKSELAAYQVLDSLYNPAWRVPGMPIRDMLQYTDTLYLPPGIYTAGMKLTDVAKAIVGWPLGGTRLVMPTNTNLIYGIAAQHDNFTLAYFDLDMGFVDGVTGIKAYPYDLTKLMTGHYYRNVTVRRVQNGSGFQRNGLLNPIMEYCGVADVIGLGVDTIHMHGVYDNDVINDIIRYFIASGYFTGSAIKAAVSSISIYNSLLTNDRTRFKSSDLGFAVWNGDTTGTLGSGVCQVNMYDTVVNGWGSGSFSMRANCFGTYQRNTFHDSPVGLVLQSGFNGSYNPDFLTANTFDGTMLKVKQKQ